jgi:hypothetical protein
MKKNKVESYFDKLKNNKILYPIIIIGIIILAIFEFVIKSNDFYKIIKREDFSKELDISLVNFDPRNIFSGETMNWGGGSQAIFIKSNNLFQDSLNKENIKNQNLWEVAGYGDVQFIANIVYNATQGSPTCVIDEWGVELSKDTISQLIGLFYNYNNIGGADAPLEGGKCIISGATGQFAIKIWYDQNEKINQPDKIHYIKPGEIIPIKVTLHIDKNYKGLEKPNTPCGADALNLKMYAKVTINGKKGISYSKERIKIIIPDSNDYIKWQLNELHWDIIEDARKFTFDNIE